MFGDFSFCFDKHDCLIKNGYCLLWGYVLFQHLVTLLRYNSLLFSYLPPSLSLLCTSLVGEVTCFVKEMSATALFKSLFVNLQEEV